MTDAIFIAIPKNAGTTIYAALRMYGCKKMKNISCFEGFENKGMINSAHLSISDLLREGYITKEFFKSAFKFCFVRNPWDRLVSLYYYCKQETEDKNSKRCMITRGTFSEFVIQLYRIYSSIEPVGLTNVDGLSQFNNQLDWICMDGKIFVDFIGRVEKIDSDYKRVCAELGIPHSVLGRYNKTERGFYREYYTDEMVGMVGEMYSKDIKEFNYSF